jgi:glucose-6-phosphate isomerase
LRDLPRYLQQLEMESNGKSVTRDGNPVACETAPIIFGDCGTVSQHSFHQWLHQGTDMVPADFIGVIEDDLRHPEHHQAVLANMAAQATALAFGRPDAASAHEVYTGNRSSNLLLLDRLDPAGLGMLLALYEHKVFVQGILWNLNSFDQPGVELGKRLAQGLKTRKNDTTGGVFAANLVYFLKK